MRSPSRTYKLCGISTPFLANLFPSSLNLIIQNNDRPSSCPFSVVVLITQTSLWHKTKSGAQDRRQGATLIEDLRRAETASYGDEYLPELHPSKLHTRSDRWFVGIDDFHIGRPTRFAGEMIYRLLNATYSYRHQLVVTAQLDRRKLRSEERRV